MTKQLHCDKTLQPPDCNANSAQRLSGELFKWVPFDSIQAKWREEPPGFS